MSVDSALNMAGMSLQLLALFFGFFASRAAEATRKNIVEFIWSRLPLPPEEEQAERELAALFELFAFVFGLGVLLQLIAVATP